MAFPLDEKFIEQAEAELGVRFPASFRNKMMQMNGGAIHVLDEVFDLLPFYDTTDKKRIKRTCNSIVHETRQARAYYGLPVRLVLFVSNGCGDSLSFQIMEDSELDPQIYLYRHDDDELQLVASDFATLLASI
ncbi:SMI1/KNR4 family protein [Undibacterium sp. Di27W]|uniref:SMI1/KNR4 family protein n=1 Tax=Undibacterium sp. Di27W TaxID=3413036 RepID=UPI003BF31469